MPTFYVVRHAKAGSRGNWTGDDRKRPLSKSGMQQAEDLVSLLAEFPIKSVFSSPYPRCVQTVEPLARARGLEVERTSDLAEGHGLAGLYKFFSNASLDGAVLSTHGDLMQELVEDLTNRHVVRAASENLAKGSTWVVDVEHGSPVRARYIPAP